MLRDSAYRLKSVSVDAIVSCVLGAVAILCLIGAVVISYLYGGKGPAVVGLLGIGALMSAAAGIVFCVAAWKTEEGGLSLKRAALVVNGFPMLITIIFYVAGWIL